MKRCTHPDAKAPLGKMQRGFTLIELMISIAISLFVLLAISSLYLTQKRTFNTQDVYSTLQDTGRVVDRLLTHDLRLAGYLDVTSASPSVKDTALAGTNDDGFNSSDSITISFYGSSAPVAAGAPATIADGATLDCQGNGVARDTKIVEVYSIQQLGATEPGLYCSVNGAAAQLIVSGVESMQFLYGVDISAAQDGSTMSFVPATAASMAKVKAVMVSIVVRSPTISNGVGPTLFNLFGNGYASGGVAPTGDAGSVFKPAADGRLRQIYAFTAAVRNRITS